MGRLSDWYDYRIVNVNVNVIVAGIALGSLAMRTKSIYSGFLVHITVAGVMDWTSLASRHALPTQWLPPGMSP
jgi:hypothetical protein